MSSLDVVAFDADDTLWHNERLYVQAQERYAQILSRYHPAEWVRARLYQTETQNLAHFGYGIKAFALSMIETAVELTEGRVSGADIQAIIGLAKEMLSSPVVLLEHVAETIPQIAATNRLILITKGDLLDQENKIANSGLAPYFQHIEIVSQKDEPTYARILQKHNLAPQRFLMVGNSLRSDILPVLSLGTAAVYIPYETTWAHESADLPPAHTPGFYKLDHIGLLPSLLETL